MSEFTLNRREFLRKGAVSAGAVSVGAVGAPALAIEGSEHGMPSVLPQPAPVRNDPDDPIRIEDVHSAQRLTGLSFSDTHIELMLEDLSDQRENYAQLREHTVANRVAPAFFFDPRIGGTPIPEGGDAITFPDVTQPDKTLPDNTPDNTLLDNTPDNTTRPADGDLAFASITDLGRMLRRRAISSVELTTFFLSRLDDVGRRLEAVVTLTPERALAAAERADRELRSGIDRGPLHGIPYGAKDLLAVAGYRTTWGAMPYRDQVLDNDATVIRKLDEAGAVLVAKLSLGALAWGDVWFGGRTRNPWNTDQGSSGSSAGPGAAVSAGLVPFAIGSETLGSIVSPATRNGVTGHRPTFGLVSRAGAMTLSWTMDKLGPMARSALDCALVYNAIRGRDAEDPATLTAPFRFDHQQPLDGLRVGILVDAFNEDYQNAAADSATLEVIRSLGVQPRPVAMPSGLPVDAMLLTLSVEAATAFDDLTRSGADEDLVRQGRNAWPNVFRASRFVPAVEYLQANRLRVELCRQMHQTMSDFDVIISPSFGGGTLRITNLTGHPAVCIPNAFHPVEDDAERKSPGSISFVGKLFGDGAALRLAAAVQERTDFHKRRPPVS